MGRLVNVWEQFLIALYYYATIEVRKRVRKLRKILWRRIIVWKRFHIALNYFVFYHDCRTTICQFRNKPDYQNKNKPIWLHKYIAMKKLGLVKAFPDVGLIIRFLLLTSIPLFCSRFSCLLSSLTVDISLYNMTSNK